MASLTEVYEGNNGAGLRRLSVGVTVFGVGALLLVTGIIIGATGVGQRFGLGLYETRELAGILGGLGLPAILIGMITVLPRSSTHIRIAAGVGAVICVVGLFLFRGAYPIDWVGGSGNASMTLIVATTYVGGALISSWSLFTAVANFKARNDPGGTVSLEITQGGETRIVDVEGDSLRRTLSGIGLMGSTPDGSVETQTNTGPNVPRATSPSATVSDGGAAADDAVFLDDGNPIRDTYCGNCTHFRYARSDDGLVPYCDFDGVRMDNMDACDSWEPN